MKKIYFLFLTFLTCFIGFGQATDLYFGMYGEGSSSNKFLQIYNGTGAAVDLGDYSVELYSNGDNTATNTQTFDAGTILAAGDVYVLYNGSSNATIIAAGDESSSTTNFNGDDAVALLKLGTVIDVIGEIGVDPGNSWDVGSTTGGTLNHTLIRKSSVCSPNATALGSFGTDDATSEWDVYASDSQWDQLTSHIGCSSSPILTVTSPSNNDVFTSGDVTIEVSVQNFTVADGSGDGHIHYTVDAGAVVMKYDTDPIDLTGLSIGMHTVALELVDNNHASLTPAVIASVTFEVAGITQVNNLTDLRAAYDLNGEDGTVYEVLSTPTITYMRSSGNQKYIQDSSNAGILIYDPSATIATTFTVGDGITGLTGTLADYNGVLEFVPTADASVAAGTTVTPANVDIATLLTNWEDYESMLVSVGAVSFDDADGSAVFASNTNYTISDGSSMTFRAYFSEADYIGEVIPNSVPNLVVLVGEYNGAPQVVARDLSDMNLANGSFEQVTFGMYPNPVAKAGNFTIVSNGNGAINVEIYDMLGKQVKKQTVNNNTVSVANLNTGIYLVKISQGGATTTQKLVVR